MSAAGYRLQEWTAWLAFCVLAMSLTWVWGHGGIFSFAQAAFFGVGAYGYGAAGINIYPRTHETLTALGIAALAAAVMAAAVAYFLFYGEVSGIYVAIVTLAVTLVLYTLVSGLGDPKYRIGDAAIGGFNGMTRIPPLSVPGLEPLSARALFQFTAACAICVAASLTVLRRSTFGRVVRAIAQNPVRARLLGYDVRRYNLITFIVGAAVAGIAGALYASWSEYVDPSVFGLSIGTGLITWVLVGGKNSIIGAFIGVFALEQLSTSISQTGSTSTPLVVGTVLITTVLVMPSGLVPTLVRLVRRLRTHLDRPEERAQSIGSPAIITDLLEDRTGASVEVQSLVKEFGGVRAVSHLDLSFGKKGVRVLLGPNGAGKSTLFHVLVGNYRPTSGRVLLDNVDISRKRPDVRARNGMAIKLQVTSLFAELTLHENVWLAAYGGSRDRSHADAIADRVVEWLGYSAGDARRLVAGAIAHGKQQWLDIGMAVATRPAVLLLDEPAAGMGREESTRVADLIRALGDNVSVIVVEHDMQFVEELRAPVSVLHQGTLLAEGLLAEMRENDDVLDVYLGRDADAAS
jgi:branched-chain amino acid transport system permease protein